MKDDQPGLPNDRFGRVTSGKAFAAHLGESADILDYTKIEILAKDCVQSLTK